MNEKILNIKLVIFACLVLNLGQMAFASDLINFQVQIQKACYRAGISQIHNT
jgi:hypothetical protein